MRKRAAACVLLLLGCAHKPPTTSGAERKRVPVNSAEQQAQLAFCADLGITGPAPTAEPLLPGKEEARVRVEGAGEPPESPSSKPSTLKLNQAEPAAKSSSSYVMRVGVVGKNAAFKPSAEQVSELVPYLREAERVEVRAYGAGPEEKPANQRAGAAREFLLKQGVPASRIWLQVLPEEEVVSGEEPSAPVGVAVEVHGRAR